MIQTYCLKTFSQVLYLLQNQVLKTSYVKIKEVSVRIRILNELT